MQISNIDWWSFGIAFIFTCMFAWGLVRKTEQEQLANMRGDGLTEEDIERILGTETYNKITK